MPSARAKSIAAPRSVVSPASRSDRANRTALATKRPPSTTVPRRSPGASSAIRLGPGWLVTVARTGSTAGDDPLEHLATGLAPDVAHVLLVLEDHAERLVDH